MHIRLYVQSVQGGYLGFEHVPILIWSNHKCQHEHNTWEFKNYRWCILNIMENIFINSRNKYHCFESMYDQIWPVLTWYVRKLHWEPSVILYRRKYNFHQGCFIHLPISHLLGSGVGLLNNLASLHRIINL